MNDFDTLNSDMLDDVYSGAIGKKSIGVSKKNYRIINPSGSKMFDIMNTPNGYLISLSVLSALNVGTVINGIKKNIKSIDGYHYNVIEFDYVNPRNPKDLSRKYVLASDVQEAGVSGGKNTVNVSSNFRNTPNCPRNYTFLPCCGCVPTKDVESNRIIRVTNVRSNAKPNIP